MRILKLVLPLTLVCLIAAACSSDGEDSAPAPPTSEVVETPVPDLAEATEGLTPAQHELSEAIFTVMLEDAERPAAVTPDQVRCLGDNVASAFSDERIAELGLNGAQLTAVYVERGTFALGDDFDITDDETSQIVDKALECMDWRAVMAEAIASEGVPADQARCIASEISVDGIRSAVEAALVAESEDDYGIAEPEALEAFQACVNVRELLYQTLLQEGLSEQSARCVADGLPEEVVDMMLGGQEPEGEEALDMIGALMELQTRCLTPEELEAMGGSGFGPDPAPTSISGSVPCPPANGAVPQILYFDAPQPMCLDTAKQYTAVFDTTAGEMRIALDMVNTPITANNFAVLAQYHYYDDTLLFRTDPSIGIIQGGAPHTNSPSDPGPGYTIPDEGSGFTYEPGQIVMARTAAPNSASAQFFFAVNEQTARLNSQGTYVVFGQMDDESLAVAEAILASHVDQPDNPLGGGPEPPVFVNSVTIEETG